MQTRRQLWRTGLNSVCLLVRGYVLLPLADLGAGAWDLNWELTFSTEMGFVKTGTDIKGLINTGESIMRYLGIVGVSILPFPQPSP